MKRTAKTAIKYAPQLNLSPRSPNYNIEIRVSNILIELKRKLLVPQLIDIHSA